MGGGGEERGGSCCEIPIAAMGGTLTVPVRRLLSGFGVHQGEGQLHRHVTARRRAMVGPPLSPHPQPRSTRKGISVAKLLTRSWG